MLHDGGLVGDNVETLATAEFPAHPAFEETVTV